MVILAAVVLGGCRQLAGYAGATPDAVPDAAVPDLKSDLRDAPPTFDVGPSAGQTHWSISCGVAGVTPDGGPANGITGGLSVAVDREGNSYVAGVIAGPPGSAHCAGRSLTLHGQQDILLLKLDPQGKAIWAITAGGPGEDAGQAIALTPSGAIYLAGYFSGQVSLGGNDVDGGGGKSGFVAKLDADGSFQWVRHLEGNNDHKLLGVAAAGEDVVAVGWFGSNTIAMVRPGGTKIVAAQPNTAAGKKDVVIVRLDASGEAGWLSTCGGSGDDAAERVAVASVGDEIFVSGYFDSPSLRLNGTTTLKPSGGRDAMVLSLAGDGTITGGTAFGGSAAEEAHGIAATDGGAVVTGWFRSRVAAFGTDQLLGFSDNDDDLFVASYRSDAKQLVEAKRFGSLTNDSQEAGFGIALLTKGDVVVVGASSGAFAFGPTPIGAGKRILVGRLAATTLAAQDAVTAAVGGGRAWAVAVAPSGDLVVTGYFTGTASFDASEKVTATGQEDLFVWKLTPP